MEKLREAWAVTLLGLQTIPSRLGPALVIVIGMACTVGASVSILSMTTGFLQTMENTGRADRAIILSSGSNFEYASNISRPNSLTIADVRGIKRTADGKPIASAEILTVATVTKKADGLDTYVDVRGIGPQGVALRPEIKLVSGRMFQPGKGELIVGKSAQAMFLGMDIGDEVELPQGHWVITGVFESGGNALESDLLTDSVTLLATLRANAFMTETVMLETPAAFATVKNALTSNPTLSVDVTRENEYYANLAKNLDNELLIIAYVVGGVMGLGTIFGVLNTMYSAVNARMAEIATLRTIGFGGGAVLISVLTEAILLAGLGALIGSAFAWFVFNGNMHSMGGTVIRLTVTPTLIGEGVLFAGCLAFLGALFPAIRGVRLPLAMALRAV